MSALWRGAETGVSIIGQLQSSPIRDGERGDGGEPCCMLVTRHLPPPTHALTPLQIALLICWANWWWVAKLEIPTEGKFSLQNIAWEWESEDFRSGPQETQPTAFGKEQGMPHGMTYKIGFEQSFLCGGHKHGKVGQATFTLFIPLIRPLSLLFSLPSLRPLQFLASHFFLSLPFRGNSQVA